jgi:hypothetical protein
MSVSGFRLQSYQSDLDGKTVDVIRLMVKTASFGIVRHSPKCTIPDWDGLSPSPFPFSDNGYCYVRMDYLQSSISFDNHTFYHDAQA